MTTIHSDVADTENTAASYEDATDAFLTSFGAEDEDAHDEPSDEGQDENEDETTSEDEGDDTEGSDENPETDAEDDQSDDDGKEKAFADDGAYVKLKIDGEEKEVPVKDLTRLYGQEAALTRKSQEVAELRRVAETTTEKHVAALNVLLQRASEKAKVFKGIDWVTEARNPDISQEEFAAIRAQAQHALEEEAFLSQNLDGFMQEVHKQQHTARVESAKACVTALTTAGTEDKPNPHHIEGWSDQTYDAVRSFGVSMGLPADVVNSLTDPAAIKMMHMAMQFSKAAKKVTTIKVNKTPKKIVKTSTSPAANRKAPGVADRKAAITKLKRNGNDSSASIDAFMASMGGDDD